MIQLSFGDALFDCYLGRLIEERDGVFVRPWMEWEPVQLGVRYADLKAGSDWTVVPSGADPSDESVRLVFHPELRQFVPPGYRTERDRAAEADRVRIAQQRADDGPSYWY